MNKLLVVVLAVVSITGCATTTKSLRPMQVADHADELLSDGRAVIPGEQGDVAVSADDVIDVRIKDLDGVERPMKLTVRALVSGCGADGRSDCLAMRAIDDPVLQHHRTHLDGGKLATLVAIATVGSGIGYCVVECKDHQLQHGVEIAGGVVLGAVLLVGALASGRD